MTLNQADHSVQLMSRTLGVSRSGFYSWSGRSPSARSVADGDLTERIKKIHTASKETYGAPRIHAELADEGILVPVLGPDMVDWTVADKLAAVKTENE